MKYKVGDKVLIKSLDWYNKNKDDDGIVELSTRVFIPEMIEHCGQIVTIKDVFEDTDGNAVYYMDEIVWDWTDEMIEGLVEEEVKDMGEVSDGYHTFNELYEYRKLYNAALFNEFAEKELYDVHKSKLHCDGKVPFDNPDYFIVVAELPTGQISNHYRMKDWDLFNIPEKKKSNEWDGHTPQDVTERLRTFLMPKPKYPQTYEECANILLDRASCRNDIGYKGDLLVVFQKLLVCRDAYWKIAGDEMGLGKSWKPNWEDFDQDKFCIRVENNEVIKIVVSRYQRILAFPTVEMRDSFYNAFKKEIEECKELL